MTHISKIELKEFARVLVLANTPRSLYGGLMACSGMNKIRKCSAEDLRIYYDHITARARRSELVMALAYAVMCGILLKAKDQGLIGIDVSRLDWGQNIADYVAHSAVRTGIFTSTNTIRPSVHVEGFSNKPAVVPGVILGLDGKPVRNLK
jgi:hypothetical protein